MLAALAAILIPVPDITAGDSAADIWIEAEDFSSGNFPPDSKNPYAPKEFWEEAVLSGGKWVAMKWENHTGEQPFLEFSFNAPRTATYHLYGRQFYSFARLRWKVGGGDWVESPDPLPAPLDFVAMRDQSGERVSLNWFPLGSVHLTVGTHTLRVEPIYRKVVLESGIEGDYCPIGYDAFLLTTELFFPNGKERPGKGPGLQTPRVFAPQREIDRFEDCPIDWRSLNEKFAGESGGIVLKNNSLVFRDNGLPARLFGVNVSMQAFGDKQAVAYLARLLAKLGVNLVRIDVADIFSFNSEIPESPRFSIQENKRNVLIDAICAFRSEGIYSALTWHMSNTVGIRGGLMRMEKHPESPESPNWRALAPFVLFDPALQNAVLHGWTDLLASRLPGGKTLGADPCLALITLFQQESIFARGAFDALTTVPAVKEAMEKSFGGWIGKNGSLSETLASWKGTPLPGDNPDQGRAGVQSPEEIALWRDDRARATARFLAETQKNYLGNLAGDLREKAGFKGLISGSNRPAADAAALGWINAWSLDVGDVHERQATFAGHFEAPRDIWLADPGARFMDRSAVRLDPLPDNESARFDIPLRAFSYSGRPTLMGEISWPLPNRFRGEMVPMASVLSRLQGVDVVVFGQLRYPYWQSFQPSTRLDIFTPGVLGQFPAFAYAFRTGLLPSGPVATEIEVSENSAFSLQSAGITENPDIQANLPPPMANPLPADGIHPLFWFSGKTRLRLGSAADSFRVPTLHKELNTLISAGGAVKWNFENGLLTVDAPSVKVVCGFLDTAGEVSLGSLSVHSPMEFGSICVVSIDGQPIESSKRILVQAFSEESNLGAFSEGDHIRTLLSAGRPPISVRNLQGEIEIKRADSAELVVSALDYNGGRKVVVATGGSFRLLPSTMYYLIEK